MAETFWGHQSQGWGHQSHGWGHQSQGWHPLAQPGVPGVLLVSPGLPWQGVPGLDWALQSQERLLSSLGG